MIFNLKPKALFALIVMMIVLLFSCSTVVEENDDTEENETLIDLTPEQAYQLIMDNSDDLSFIILDVRTEGEYRAGHLISSINIDYYDSSFETQLNQLNKDYVYLVYCGSGVRSNNTLNLMKSVDFKKYYQIIGGYMEWTNNNYPITSP